VGNTAPYFKGNIMREYPRIVYKEDGAYLKVFNEEEEMKASGDGYESHKNKEINLKRKGTDREILRAKKVEAVKKAEPVKKVVSKPKAK
jgi:hypothetical protein